MSKKFDMEDLAVIIDTPQEEFEKGITDSQANMGNIQSLLVLLNGVYSQCVRNKENILERVAKGVFKIDDPEVVKCLNGLYIEMMKIENKVKFLKARHEELLDRFQAGVKTPD